MSKPHYDDYLLEENQRATSDNIALFEAALKGDFEQVKELLENGAKPNFFFRPEDQKNALHVSSEKGFDDIVQVLIQHGAAVNSKASTDQTTSLILASQNGHVKVVQILLSHGAHVDSGISLPHHSSKSELIYIIIANAYGNTSLHEACHAGSPRLIEALLDARAPINAENHKGSTPLHLYCYGEKNTVHGIEGLEILIRAGANVNARDHRGATPLLVCCASGR